MSVTAFTYHNNELHLLSDGMAADISNFRPGIDVMDQSRIVKTDSRKVYTVNGILGIIWTGCYQPVKMIQNDIEDPVQLIKNTHNQLQEFVKPRDYANPGFNINIHCFYFRDGNLNYQQIAKKGNDIALNEPSQVTPGAVGFSTPFGDVKPVQAKFATNLTIYQDAKFAFKKTLDDITDFPCGGTIFHETLTPNS